MPGRVDRRNGDAGGCGGGQSGDRGRTDSSVKGVHGEIEKPQTSRWGEQSPHSPTGVHGEMETPESSKLVRSSSAWSDECEAVLNGSESMQVWETFKEARKEDQPWLCSSLSPVRHGTLPQLMISQHATGARPLLYVTTNLLYYCLTLLVYYCLTYY